MASELISGPAGGGKSQVVRQRLADNPGAIAIDSRAYTGRLLKTCATRIPGSIPEAIRVIANY